MTAWALLALPSLTAALTLGIARRGTLAAFVAVAGGAATLVLAVVALAGAPTGARGAPFAEELATGPGHVFGGLDMPLGVALSATSAFLALVVALVTALVQVYSAWYLADDDRRGSFHATVALFSAAMLLVILSADLLLTVVGWEVMGWCSWLLIGHWSRRPEPRRAAHAAFLVTRVADIGLVLGTAVLVAGAGTTARAGVVDHWTSAAADPGTRSAALVLLVIGVLGKSAQLPFHHWLLDAMQGPTPASALIHAATMVAAGTVVLTQLLPLLLRADAARALLGLSVAVTMVLAALCALAEADVKRVLAWSTISQVGVMLAPLAAAGAGHTAGAALGHLYGHAIFKALLFLTGVPLVLGGLTKEHVVAAVGDDIGARGPVAHLVLAALLLTVVLTAAYATRVLLLVVLGEQERVRSRAVMPGAVAGVLIVLAVASTIGGLALGVRLPATGHVPLGLFALVLLLVVAGIVLGYALERLGVQGRLADGPVGRAVGAGLGLDRAQQVLVVTPVTAAGRLVSFVDRAVLDTYVRGAAWGVLGLSDAGTAGHRRSRPTSGLALLGGGLLLLGLVTALALVGPS
ncbi:NADH-quinone oxidoreductase subunit L [Janibacter sp. RAF20_2_2]